MAKPIGLLLGVLLFLTLYLGAFGMLTARDQRRHWPDQARLHAIFAPCWRVAEDSAAGSALVHGWLRLFGYQPLVHAG